MGMTVSTAAHAADVAEPVWSDHESGARPLTNAMLSQLSTAIEFRPSIAVRVPRDRIRELCAAHRFSDPRLFGSIARGTDTADSDIDLLVAAEPGTTMFDLIAFESDLEALCGVSVDVVTDGAVRAGGASWSQVESIAL